jgi:CBS domain-containing protein
MKKGFDSPVSGWMVSPVITVQEADLLTTVETRFRELGVAALPVLDASSRLTGIISELDLLRAGRFRSEPGGRARQLRLPDIRVGECMQTSVPVVRRELSLAECAQRMLRHEIHRLYVAEDGPLEGVVSTREMVQAVAEARIEIALQELMIPVVAHIAASDTLRTASLRLRGDPAGALVVMAGDAPIGIFSPAEAAMSNQADPNEAVELWMDASILSLPARSPIWRAAEQLLAEKARYLLATEAPQGLGYLSGLHFARIVSGIG